MASFPLDFLSYVFPGFSCWLFLPAFKDGENADWLPTGPSFILSAMLAHNGLDSPATIWYLLMSDGSSGFKF